MVASADAFRAAWSTFEGPRARSRARIFPATLWVTSPLGPSTRLLFQANAVRAQVWAVDKNQPVSEIASLEQYLTESAALPRLRTWLLGSFSVVALLLAVVGIYGIVQYSVSRRVHEIGVRLALGATPAGVVGLILRGGLKLILLGVAIGLAGAAVVTRFLANILFNIRPDDAATFTGVSLALIFVALIACYIPARRALRIDPAAALRQE